jgi:signal transduction histidine kinase
MDSWAVVRASQAISGELLLAPLLRRFAQVMVEVSAAERGYVIVPQEGTLALEIEVLVDAQGFLSLRTLESQPLDLSSLLPRSIVRAVARDLRPVRIDDVGCAPASWPDLCRPDSRNSRNCRSITCLPVLGRPAPESGSAPELAAIAYLESARVAGFPPATAEALACLADQAAISLRNARLHRETLQSLRVREDFLSVAAHELYTPLSSLKLVLDTLAPTVPGAPLPEPALLERSVEIARRQGRRLERLVAELLEVSRMDTGRLRLDLREVDLGALTQEVADRFAPDLARAGCAISVQTSGPPVVGSWDHSRLDQVIANLLSNAIKFGAGQPVEVRVERSSMADAARLVVRDHGIGIEPQEHAQIFDRFQRASASRHFGGMGLGLYICRAIVQAHAGTITVASQPGAGATFTVELPYVGAGAGGGKIWRSD